MTIEITEFWMGFCGGSVFMLLMFIIAALRWGKKPKK